jgi:Cdc6-like AAA superfamily ATPase
MLAGIKKLTGSNSLRPAAGIDFRNSTFNNVGRDMHNYYPTVVYQRPANWQPLPSLSFNEAQNRSSPYFTGREEEIKRIGNALSVACDNMPTRYAIYGRAGLGKTQLASQYAEQSYPKRYSVILWISGATVENLTQGFTNILTLISHPDGYHAKQTDSARLALARRWLENSGSIKWLLIIDNIVQEAVYFLREHLPRENSSGNILLTTRDALIAEAVTGRWDRVLELHDPEPRDAAKQLMAEIDLASVPSSMSGAEDMVKFVGRLPLIISQVASLVKHFHKSLDEVLDIYQGKGKYEVSCTF